MMVSIGEWRSRPPQSTAGRLWLLRGVLAVSLLILGFIGLPWWTIVIPAFIAGLTFARAGRGFGQVALVVALVWIVVAVYQDFQTGWRLSSRISAVFFVPFAPFAYVLTGFLAGVVGGLAGWCGQAVRGILTAVKTRY